MAMTDPAAEAEALIDHLEGRGLTEREACAVMGIVLCGLLAGTAAQKEFLRCLKSDFANRNANPEYLQ